LIQTDKYEEAVRMGLSRLWAGDDPKTILDEVAKRWDEITERVGVEKQKAVYRAWAAKPSAYPKPRDLRAPAASDRCAQCAPAT
jgi:multiple sugar transport system substrate-binding protein